MKARPRHAENSVAGHLNKFFDSIGLPPIERIPVTGRTGPDVTYNEFKLIVDCKSRLAVPKPYLNVSDITDFQNGTVGIPIRVPPTSEVKEKRQGSITVLSWLNHQEEWTLRYVPGGISAIVAHRPSMPYGKAVIVIYSKDLEAFYDRYKHYALRNINQPVLELASKRVGQPV